MSAFPVADDLEAIWREYPNLFSGELGILRDVQYDFEVVDDDLIIACLQSLKFCEIIQRSF